MREPGLVLPPRGDLAQDQVAVRVFMVGLTFVEGVFPLFIRAFHGGPSVERQAGARGFAVDGGDFNFPHLRQCERHVVGAPEVTRERRGGGGFMFRGFGDEEPPFPVGQKGVQEIAERRMEGLSHWKEERVQSRQMPRHMPPVGWRDRAQAAQDRVNSGIGRGHGLASMSMRI